MSSSLEELLAEEGFRGRKSMTGPRISYGAKNISMPLFPSKNQSNSSSSSGSRTKTERTRSDVYRYSWSGPLPKCDNISGPKPRNKGSRMKKLDQDLKKAFKEGFDSEDSYDIFEEKTQRFKDIYLNETHSSEKLRFKYSDRYMTERTSLSDSWKSMIRPEKSYDRSDRKAHNKSFQTSSIRRHREIQHLAFGFALDEVAIKALVSILTGYIKQFSKDDEFRASLRDKCFVSLHVVSPEIQQSTESKVLDNLQQAIETVEGVVDESASLIDLKKASFQLSVITSLNLKEGFTSGISICNLSACAHLYLGVIYNMQRKDKVSAKHLLQVFCDSPSQARKSLLPELWEYLFLPHLSHLEEWFNQEAVSISDTPTRPRKLNLLEKVYNEILDSGTYQFAVYYKDWLGEGVRAPSLPTIQIPSLSICRVQATGLSGPLSPQPRVSRKLYDAVFGLSKEYGVDQEGDYTEAEGNYGKYMTRSSDSSAEDKQPVLYSFEAAKPTDQEAGSFNNSHDDASYQSNDFIQERLVVMAEEGQQLHGMSSPGYSDPNEIASNSHASQESQRAVHLLHMKANELILKRLGRAIFKLQETEGSSDAIVSTPSHPNHAQIPDSLVNLNWKASAEELHASFEYCDEGSFFSSIPRDFICSLTSQIFEDPVTLETGQTFERSAISNWFDQGNKTCPVTGKTLQYLAVPVTNYILKRVIDNWKSEHSPKDEKALNILEQQLLTAVSQDERIRNARHFISLGGLQFLIWRLEFGNLEEKAIVAAMLCSCIVAEGACRNYIAKNIKQSSLLELLRSKQVKSRTLVVSLLTELICLTRRKDVTLFLNGFKKEGMMDAMHVLFVYLQCSPPEQRPLVSVLLLHLDLLLEPRKCSIYREDAVRAITMALNESLSNEKVQAQCCRALLVLGGRFSLSGEVLTEKCMLKQAGLGDGCKESFSNDENIIHVDASNLLDEEEEGREWWLRNLSAMLLGSGEKSFLETLSKCLGSANLDLVGACLTTVAWMSHALSSLANTDFQLSAFSSLFSRLKEILENGWKIEHKVLASVSLLNFCKIPECRVLLMRIAEEIATPLRNLTEVTWTAKQLCVIIYGEDL